ncbi:PepSY-associated TM helix domain-containing protein [Mangrovivirga cuniculi]|uniref:Sulfite reductase n=1 Tax=Mangrovivirga cuniculi TaxID=2715131 RepID=A0A4D7JNG9_9BACT|nr:PepSY-associated TM helix domain-containing protein [Mangrovivirga cuniculi]QCK17141.1 sulfite reductase [Mangrovivirga cuniculi]
MTVRKSFRLIHLYLGIVASLIVFIEATTGAIWVFNSEINSLIEDEITVQIEDLPLITPTVAKSIAKEYIPNKAIHGVLYPNEPGEPVEMIFYEAEPEFYTSLYLNPYNGEILKEKDHMEGFFPFILDGHLHLWLPPEIGKPIVSYGTLIFGISIITGIILWWPKNKKGRKQRFKLDWKNTTRWRRKNFDLHTVLGFYLSAFAVVFVLTGLVMALNWFAFLYYNGFGGEKELTFSVPLNQEETVSQSVRQSNIDRLPQILFNQYPEAESFEIHYPYADSASIYVEISHTEEVYYDSDYIFYDQNTLEKVKTLSVYGEYSKAELPDHLVRINYDLHVGAIGGITTKIIAFIACLMIATLPVTGILIWLGRKKKKGKMNSKQNKKSTPVLEGV